MNNSDLKLSAVFDMDRAIPICALRDETAYTNVPSGTGNVNPDFVTVYMWMNTPSGVVKNTLNTSSGIGTPDLLRLMNQSYAEIVLPSDKLQGVFSFQLQSRVWGTASLNSIVSASSSGFFEVAGNIEVDVTNLIGGYFIVDSGVNKGVYTVTSAVYDGVANTIINVDETVVNDLVGVGDFIYFESYTDYTSIVYNESIDFVLPIGKVNTILSCRTAEITLVDNTSYIANNAGAGLVPVSTTRNMNVIAPVNPDGTGFTPTSTTTANAQLVVSDIWTGIWQIGLYTQVAYSISSWFGIIHAIRYKADLLVQCDDCACTYFTCTKNLWEKYYVAVTTNATRAASIRSIMIEMEHAWMLYQMAAQCGYDTSTYCNKIKELAMADDCICLPSNGISVPVTAWAGGSGGGAGTPGSQWHNASGAPSTIIGVVGDYYLDDDSGNYYKKSGSGWVLQGNLKGSATQWLNGSANPLAADGNTGDFYLNNATKEYFEKTGASTWTSLGYLTNMIKLYEDVTNSPSQANTSWQALKTFTLPANTLSELGDEIIVEAYFTMAGNLGGQQVFVDVRVGHSAIFTGTWVSPGNPLQIRTFSKFSVTATNTFTGTRQFTVTEGAAAVVETPLVSFSENLSTAQDIAAMSRSMAGGHADVTCRYIRVYVLKK